MVVCSHLVAGDEVKSRSVDWQEETLLADRILSNQGQATYETMGIPVDELVSPSIQSIEGGDCTSERLCCQPLY